MRNSVLISDRAAENLQDVGDLREQRRVYQRMLTLGENPLREKLLANSLRSYRSLRVGRHRVLYTVDEGNGVIVIALIGIRKGNDRGDVYKVAERLVARGLLSGSS